MSDKTGAYRLSPRAIGDLEEIWLYTMKNWSPEQADTYHEAIMTAVRELAAGTRTGRAVDVREGYFKQAVGSHFIYYRKTVSGLGIVRILHQRMDVNRHL
ncbi:type II toxin-antitoxin system RelE/ParE family toxin [Arvimicrobium flavum]|uniref:type II toxin-antitoxin system RelE/ParE family toxin n=1 Tax=Arvimicrobium flavum TaxID=3393320 RepID=UPI00237BD1A1|nr:type II toxin-antitoxin system RelE/ParE family toxin [Mesorhizobium shangrilense]